MLLFESLREVMLLLDFGEHVRVVLLPGFGEQARVVRMGLSGSSALIGFW